MNRHCVDDMDINVHYSTENNMLKISGMDCRATYDNVDTYNRVLECITDFIEEYANEI